MRKIDTARFAAITRPESLGPAPELRWLPIDSLVIDDSYQRDITKQGVGNIRHIAENFSWTFFAPVIVSPIEGGRYAVIDGQHRTTAAALLGVEQVPCALVIADQKTQARAFHAINAQTTRMHPLQIFHAQLASKEPAALAAVAMAESAGVSVPRNVTTCDQHMTLAPGTLVSMAARNASVGALTLKCLTHAGERHSSSLLRSVIMLALFEVLSDHPTWRSDEARLIKAVGFLNIFPMWSAATVASAQIRGTTTCDQLQAALIDALEKRFAKVAA